MCDAVLERIVTNAFSNGSRKLLPDVNGQGFSGVWHNFPQPQSNPNYILIMFRIPDPTISCLINHTAFADKFVLGKHVDEFKDLA